MKAIGYSLISLALIGCQCETSNAAPPNYNPATLGDNFDKQTFITPIQANAIGKNIQGVVGMIGTQDADGTITVTSCSGLKSRTSIASVSDLPTPAFNAVVDTSWGLSASILGIELNLGGSSEKNVVGSPLTEASVQPTDFVDDLTARIAACHITGSTSIIASANQYLITSKTFLKGDLDGSLIYLKLSGNTYSETDAANFYAVSVFALPIATVAGKAVILRSPTQIASAGKSVLGLPSNVAAKRLGTTRDAFLPLSKSLAKGISITPSLLRTMAE